MTENVTPLNPNGEPAARHAAKPGNRVGTLMWALFFLFVIGLSSVAAVSAFLWVIVAIWTSIQRMIGVP